MLELNDEISKESKDSLLEGLYSAAFALAVDQINKLSIGDTKIIYSFNGSYTLALVNDFPLVVTLIFLENCGVGLVEQIAQPLKKFLEPLKAQVAQSEVSA
jgi:hypothetical protein